MRPFVLANLVLPAGITRFARRANRLTKSSGGGRSELLAVGTEPPEVGQRRTWPRWRGHVQPATCYGNRRDKAASRGRLALEIALVVEL